jgi:tetratricopeptide (TPR) repeat protein
MQLYDERDDEISAENIAKKAIECCPFTLEYCDDLGIVYRYLEEYEKAVEIYLKGLEYPDQEEAILLANLGACYDDLERYDEAIAEYRKSLDIAPDDAETHRLLVISLENRGDYDEALNDYRKAIELDPKNADVYNDMGVAYRKMKQFDLAKESFKTALSMDPDNTMAKQNYEYLCSLTSASESAEGS